MTQFIYARSFPDQRTVSLAAKRADILQKIVSTTFANSNYFYQSDLYPLRLVQTFPLGNKNDQDRKVFHVIFILTNTQGDRIHSRVNQSKTIIKSTMLMQLKVTQNEK